MFEGLAATDTLHLPQMRCGRNQSENLSADIESLTLRVIVNSCSAFSLSSCVVATTVNKNYVP